MFKILNLTAVITLLLFFSFDVTAERVTSKDAIHIKVADDANTIIGEYIEVAPKVWLAWNYKSGTRKPTAYLEDKRDGKSVHLSNKKAKTTINLSTNEVFHQSKGHANNKLGNIRGAYRSAYGQTVNALNTTFIRYNEGRLIALEPLYMIELTAPLFMAERMSALPMQYWQLWHKKAKAPVKFAEVGRDEWSIYLQNDETKLVVDLYTKKIKSETIPHIDKTNGPLKMKMVAGKIEENKYTVTEAFNELPRVITDELTIESIETLLTAGSMDTAGRVGFELTKSAIEAMATGGYGAAARGSVLAETIARKFFLEIAEGIPEILLNAGYNKYNEGLYRDNCKVQKATTATSRLLNEKLDNLAGNNGGIKQWKELAALPGDWFEMKVSEVDDLLVTVDGKALWSEPKEMKRGSIIYPNKKFLFRRSAGAVIQLMEKDAGAGNDDDLGAIRVTTWTDITHGEGDDCVEKYGNIYYVLAPEAEDGSFYKVVVSIKENVGSIDDVVTRQVCGTKACIECPSGDCGNINFDRVDRDKDKGDLKSCPKGFYTDGYDMYPQTWPAADVYLRKCAMMPPE